MVAHVVTVAGFGDERLAPVPRQRQGLLAATMDAPAEARLRVQRGLSPPSAVQSTRMGTQPRSSSRSGGSACAGLTSDDAGELLQASSASPEASKRVCRLSAMPTTRSAMPALAQLCLLGRAAAPGADRLTVPLPNRRGTRLRLPAGCAVIIMRVVAPY